MRIVEFLLFLLAYLHGRCAFISTHLSQLIDINHSKTFVKGMLNGNFSTTVSMKRSRIGQQVEYRTSPRLAQRNLRFWIVGSTSARRKGNQIQSITHLLHDMPVYPPKMYFPTRIIVTVGPLLSHREWKVVLAQPSTDARQQRFQ